jgi:hypothetical protein
VTDIAADTMEGVKAIAAFLGKPPGKAYYLCETHQIPAFKLAGKWHMRKSTYAAHIGRLEADAIARNSDAA